MKTRLFALVLAAPLITACTVEGGYYAGPVQVDFQFPDQRVIVVENLNRPGDCQILPFDAVFAATHRVAYGPAARAAAVDWAAEYCVMGN